MTDKERPNREPSPEAFEKFLRWLSEDREAAGQEYLNIRKKLVQHFIRLGCADPDALFDITINRVVLKVDENLGYSTPLRCCFGYAKHVWQESLKIVKVVSLPPDDCFPAPDPPSNAREREAHCLEICLGRLPENSRDLITRYYQGQGRDKIEARKALAREHGGEERLRIKAFRIRTKLRECIDDCVRPMKVN